MTSQSYRQFWGVFYLFLKTIPFTELNYEFL